MPKANKTLTTVIYQGSSDGLVETSTYKPSPLSLNYSSKKAIKPHKVNNDVIEGEDSDVVAERQNVQQIFDENKVRKLCCSRIS